jgi:agmatinase
MQKVRLLGFEWDASSSHARGSALGPSVVKRLLASEASSSYSIDLVDMRAAIEDYLIPPLPTDGAGARVLIEKTVCAAIEAGHAPLSIGGDHSVTFPILKAVAARHGPVNLVHIDAHGDLHDAYEGDPFSHASPFARAHEAGLIRRHVIYGLRCWDPEQREQARRFGVDIRPPEEWDRPTALDGPLYLSVDLDGLDPAFAPGVSHPEPGGLSTREAIALIRAAQGPIVGADIVELNPERDPMLTTARVAVRLIKELAATMTSR